MEGLVGKVTLKSGLIHSVSNYWTPSIRLEVPLPENKADKILVPIELTVRGQIITLNRGGMAYLYRGPTVCQEKISFDPYYHTSRSRILILLKRKQA